MSKNILKKSMSLGITPQGSSVINIIKNNITSEKKTPLEDIKKTKFIKYEGNTKVGSREEILKIME